MQISRGVLLIELTLFLFALSSERTSSLSTAPVVTHSALSDGERSRRQNSGGSAARQTSFYSPSPSAAPLSHQVIGALYPVFDRPSSVARVLATFRRHYPSAPVVLISDGGLNYSTLCARIMHCAWRPYKHILQMNGTYARSALLAVDMLSRYIHAFGVLASKGATHALLLEDDVRVLRPFTQKFNAAITGYIPTYRISYYRPLFHALVRAGWSVKEAEAAPYGGFGGCVFDLTYWSAVRTSDIRVMLEGLTSLNVFASDLLLTTFALTHPKGCRPPSECGRLAQLKEYTDTLHYRRTHIREASSGNVAVLHHYKREYAEPPSLEDLSLLGWESYPPVRPTLGESRSPVMLARNTHQIIGAIYDVGAGRVASMVRAIRTFRRHYPDGPVVLIGTGGTFISFCQRLGRCAWKSRSISSVAAPAVARLLAVTGAMRDLAAVGATHALLLEDDVRVLRPFMEPFRSAITGMFASYRLPPPLVAALVKAGWTRAETDRQRYGGLGGAVFDIAFWSSVDAERVIADLALDSKDSDALITVLALLFSPGCQNASFCRRPYTSPEFADLSFRGIHRLNMSSQDVRDVRERQAGSVMRILSGRAAVVDGYTADFNAAPTIEELAALGLKTPLNFTLEDVPVRGHATNLQ